MFRRWWRGVLARREMRQLLQGIALDERAARRAAELIAATQSQIDTARRLSPGDEAAAVGVMKQLYAGVSGLRRKALAGDPVEVSEVLATEATLLYLSVQIRCHDGRLSTAAMHDVMRGLATGLRERI